MGRLGGLAGCATPQFFAVLGAVIERGASHRAKPNQEFFRRIIATAGVRPGDIAYVGDRLDNDVMPAAQAGLVAVFLKRGPWGHIQPSRWDAGNAALIMNSLVKLPEALAGI